MLLTSDSFKFLLLLISRICIILAYIKSYTVSILNFLFSHRDTILSVCHTILVITLYHSYHDDLLRIVMQNAKKAH